MRAFLCSLRRNLIPTSALPKASSIAPEFDSGIGHQTDLLVHSQAILSPYV
jgi:hypothetical protein